MWSANLHYIQRKKTWSANNRVKCSKDFHLFKHGQQTFVGNSFFTWATFFTWENNQTLLCWLNKAKEREREPRTLLLCCEKKVTRMRRGKSQVMNKIRGRWEGICVKWISKHFSLLIFLIFWEDKKSGPRRENFLSSFLSLLFFFLNQTVKNNIFYPIFFSLFSILPVFTPTKHTLKAILNLSPRGVCSAVRF